MQADATLEGQLIGAAVDNALKCLRTSVRSAATGSGWYHYLDDPQPGVTASAVGLYTFALAGQRFERTAEVVRFLLSQQVTSTDDRDGGWAVRTTNGVPIIEATAWVVRALRLPGVDLAEAGDSLRRGVAWIERNQNTDFGWGSYRGQPSRVFHTALTMLALQEGGGTDAVISNSQRWLIESQNVDQPAWGPIPGAPPTLLHTSFVLLALARREGALSSTSVRDICDWIFERLEPGAQVEQETTVEEYDVPLPGDSRTEFQNSLPHFAGPVALAALLHAGADPFRTKMFAAATEICAAQTGGGSWVLPRSPVRPSIWAIWPFVAALSSIRAIALPTPTSRAHLVFQGCCIVHTENTDRQLTRRILIKNAAFDWLRRRRIDIVLYGIALLIAGTAAALLLLGLLGPMEALLTLLVPVLLVAFQLVWSRRRGGDP